MSITLYTPATGFPDLEAKIAYGLARVGIEAGAEVSIIPHNGFYEVDFYSPNGKSIDLNRTFCMLLNRLLSSQRFYNLGVKAKDKRKYMTVDENREIFKAWLCDIDLSALYKTNILIDYIFTKEKSCRHCQSFKFGATKKDKKQLGGLIFLASIHAGKPQYRDNRRRDLNLGLCEACGYLNVLGKESFSFEIQLGTGKNRKFVWALPIPTKKLENSELITLLSMQKTLYNFWLSDLLPLRTFILGLLAKVPSISNVVKDLQLSFHLSLLSKDNRGDTVVEQTELVDTIPIANFISYSSYNSATVSKLLGTAKNPPKVSTLIDMTNLIQNSNRTILSKFARLYVLETTPKDSKKWVSLLYPETVKYLLKEVAMISSEIIENHALGSLARTLRYFIREKKYGYADDIRNARKESKDFEDTIAKMLREGRLRLEQKEKIHLPTDEEMKEVFRLANADFDKTKTALVILAFSFPARVEEEVTEITEEVQNA